MAGPASEGPGVAMKMASSAKDVAGAPVVLADRLRLSMIRLSRMMRRNDPSELSMTQLSLLATVVREGPLGVGQLAEIENLPSPAVTRLADKLEEAGFVERQTNPGDRRGVLVVATSAGRGLLARRQRTENAWFAERLAALSAPERAALERAVGVLEALTGAPPNEQSRR